MAPERTHPIKAVVHKQRGQTSNIDQVLGEVTVRELTKKERTTRALKFLGVAWLGAIISVGFPILHFLLVPAFFVSGPFVAAWAYRQTFWIQKGSIPCPQCRNPAPILEGPERWPRFVTCEHCKHSLSIDKLH